MKLCGLAAQTWRKIIETHQQASVDVVPTSEFTETEVPLLVVELDNYFVPQMQIITPTSVGMNIDGTVQVEKEDEYGL